MGDSVRIVFLGGLGGIGRNCCCIEVDDRILLVDCGIMFPDADMPGVDLVLPDFTYLRENADNIVGVVATHGHEDHVGALQYLLRELSFPIYGSALTLGLARNRIEEAGLLGRTELIAVKDGEFVGVTHLLKTDEAKDMLHTGLTGVRREHRGAGVAYALKVKSLEDAKAAGYNTVLTWNESNNRRMLAVNERVGFVRQPAWVDFVRTIKAE